MTILYLATKPEPLSITEALLKKSVEDINVARAEAARAVDEKRWLREVAQSVRDERANVAKKRAALVEASKGDFKNVAALFVQQHAAGDLIEAQDRLNLALEEFFTITQGRK